MILPPEEIKIKRKRTDEPVDILHIQEPLGKKRRCVTDFVFCRQPKAVATAAPVISQTVPTIQVSRRPLSPNSTAKSEQKPKNFLKSNGVTKPRHFHIYRPTTIQTPNTESFSRKRKADTIFVERRLSSIRKPRLEENNVPSPVSSLDNKTNLCQTKKILGPSSHSQKLPCKVQSSAPLRNVRLPSGDIIPWDVTSEKLIAEMQAYTLSEINKSIAKSEKKHLSDASDPQVLATSITTERKQNTRFKPKTPSLRYKDRHQNQVDTDSDNDYEIECYESIDDENENDDWVVEKYLRMPIEDAQTEDCDNYGFLVLDSQAEIEEFFQDDASSVEEDEEDEDENAENHYTADYPEDEIELDDEFDLNAYNYTNDIDEFGVDALSDDDIDENRKYPWVQKPWIGKLNNLNYDDDSDEEC
ncbi:hypothetical protein OnM2_020066 [Erysiphe neolycopersici]|uniref:Transcription factor Iwr1 domain-containing protein n=1 Tax=Erysiphe neolycopersici TaxID=212602 RepID=A0A420I3K8_9PEZI|nr:hypothetical protein OnM2_020066 [Erysiphe neolycopersici]